VYQTAAPLRDGINLGGFMTKKQFEEAQEAFKLEACPY